MSPAPDAEEIFHSARAVSDPVERARLLDRSCGEDADLRALVESLLAADAEAGEFLRSVAGAPRTDPAPGSANSPESHDRPGAVFGRYTVLQEIGEGGFGVVYMAEQREPVRRRVALKVIKLGMDTRQVIGRFEAERQALAMMDHPNIATVLDAGSTEAGRLYFVMEYINGVSITEYCDAAQLDTGDRLALFMQVCHAIQHAHQKGVIHRDIKPSNVLVTLHDGVPVPKVIDFGIAKATSAELTARTFFTEHRQMIGTPAYMSPEQAEMSGLDIDTRSDIYSLGVLLYELLTSTTPFDSKELLREGLAEMLRNIREVEPDAPSTRMSSLSKAAVITAGQRRALGASQLGRTLKGDLDCIVMKCLEKDRTRRYETAGELAQDVQRYLDGEPILAASPSQVYRFKKFVRRHRGLVVAGCAVALTLVVGILGTTAGLVRARSARFDADRRAEEARQASDTAQRERLVAQRLAYRASLFSASEELARGQVGAARAELQAAPADLRGWEWRHLSSRLDTSLRTQENGSPIRDLHVAPDGESYHVVSWDPTRSVQRWDAATGRLMQTISTDVRCDVSWVIDGGHHLALRQDDQQTLTTTLEVWDVERGVRLSSWPVPGGPVLAVSDSLALCMSPEGFSLRDVATGSLRALLLRPTGSADFWETAACFGPAGRRLAVTWPVGQIRLFDVETRETLTTFKAQDEGLTATAFSPDGTRLATGSVDGTVRVTDLTAEPPRTLATLHGHVSRVLRLVFSPDGSLLASSGLDGTERAWDLRTGNAAGVFEMQTIDECPMAFFPDSHTLIVSDGRGQIHFLDARADEACILRGHESYVYSVLLSPDGGTIYSGGWDAFLGRPGSLRIWDTASGEQVAATGERIAAPCEPDEWVVAAALSPDGSALALSSVDSTSARVSVIDTATGAAVVSIPVPTFTGVRGALLSLAFDPSGRRIAWLDRPGEAVISDARTGATLASRSVPGREEQWPRLAWSPDGSTIATCCGGQGEFSLWDGTTLEPIRQWSVGNDGASTDLAFSPDGRQVVSTSERGEARVWDVATGTQLRELVPGGRALLCARYSPDGRRLAIGGLDGGIYLWDARSFAPVARLVGHTNYVFSLAWSADSEVLVSGSGDHTVRIWDTQPPRVRLEARRERQALVAQVEPKVRSLFDDLGDAQRVAEAVKADPALSDRARQVALQVVLATSLGSASSEPDAQAAAP